MRTFEFYRMAREVGLSRWKSVRWAAVNTWLWLRLTVKNEA